MKWKAADFKPIGGRVLVRPDPEETTYGSGILVRPGGREERPLWATVVASDCDALELGTRVYHKPYAGSEIECEDGAHLVLEEEDILGVMPT